MKKKVHKLRVKRSNEKRLNEFLKKVNEAKEKWQNEALIKISNYEAKLIYKGIIIAATGTGKTRLQAKLIIKLAKVLDGFGLIIVKSPRIALAQQLTKEISKVVKEETNLLSIMFHSGNDLELMDEEELKRFKKGSIEYKQARQEALKNALKIEATTDLTRVEAHIEEAKNENCILIVQTTYHSFNKLCRLFTEKSLKIDMILNDEGQYLAQKEFNKGLNLCNALREYTFTATPTEGPVGSSAMYWGEETVNPSYGVEMEKLTTGRAIELGIICGAKIIRLDLNHTESDARGKNHKIILESHLALEKDLGRKANSLVTEAGVKDIETLLKPQSELMKKISDNFHVMTITSQSSLITDNGIQINRNEFMERVKMYSENENISLIVIHYDILSEGIDVPSMDGVLILRKVSISKFYQILGRCLRVQFGKKYGYLIIPNYTDYSDLSTWYTQLRNNMFDKGYLPKQGQSEDRGSSSPSDDPDPIEKQLSHGDLLFKAHMETQKEIKELIERMRKVNKPIYLL
jgi:predicted helicase